MRRVLLISDTHLRGRDLSHRLKVYDYVLNSCFYYDLVIHLGDLFDQGNIGDRYVKTAGMVSAFTSLIDKHKIPHIIICGNHDLSNDVSALNCLNHNLIAVVNKPKVLKIGKKRCLFIPWCAGDRDTKQKIIDLLKFENQLDYVFGHFDCVGANSNFYVTENDQHSLWCFRPEHFNSIPTFAGHIHTPQRIGPVEYVGCIEPLNHNEANNKSRALSLDLLTGEVEEVLTNNGPESVAARYLTTCNENDLIPPHESLHIRWTGEDIPDWVVKSGYGSFKHIKTSKKEKRKDTIDIEENVNAQSLYNDYCELTGIDPCALDKLEEIDQVIQQYCRHNKAGLQSFDSIQLKNIGKNFHEFSLDFTDGFNLIYGENGYGKSTILDALYAGLYGFYPYEGRGGLPNLLNGPEGLIRVVARSSDGQPHEVLRTITKTGSKGKIDSDKFKLKSDIDSRCEELFGFKEITSRICYIDQLYKFDMIVCTDGERMTTLRKLLGLDYFDKVDEFLSAKVKEFHFERIDKELERQLELQKIELSKELEIKDSIPKLSLEVEQLEAQLAELEKNNWKDYNRELKEAIISVKDKDYLLYRNLSSQILNLTNEIEAKDQMKQSDIVCPNCGYSNVEFISKLDKEIKELMKSLFEVKKAQASLGFIESKLRVVEASGIEITKENLENYLNNLNTSYDKIKELRTIVKQKINSLGQLEAKLNLAKESNFKLKSKIDRLYKDKIEAKEWKHLQEVFGKKGIPNLLVSSAVNELQEILDYIIETGEFPIMVTMATQKDTINGSEETLRFLFGNEKYDIKSASGGERNLVRVLWRMALFIYMQRHGNHYQVLIMDEPTQGIDKDRSHELFALIKKMSNNFKQIIVVTHDDTLSQYASNVITL